MARKKPRTKRTNLTTSLAVARRDLRRALAERDGFGRDAALLRIEQFEAGLAELEAKERAAATKAEAA